MSVTVIIPYHSGKHYLDLCLASLLKERAYFDKVLIVSNNSSCEPPNLGIRDSLVEIIHFKDNLGYSAAVNKGAEIAQSRFLLLCDADVFFPERGWIQTHLQLHETRPNVGMTSSKLLNYRTGRILDFGIGRTRLNHFHPFRDALAQARPTLTSRRVQMACSAVAMVPRTLFCKLGGLDTQLRHFFQDVDLCLRMNEREREIWVLGEAVAYHKGSSSTIRRRAFQIDERAYYTSKNHEHMVCDYSGYLAENIATFESDLRNLDRMGVVNVSTNNTLDELLPAFEACTELKMLATIVPEQRDMEALFLMDLVGALAHEVDLPLLFIVDRHISLEHNHAWRASRDTSRDYVVDRHANVCRFDDLFAR